MATRSSWLSRRTQSTRRYIRTSISISSVTLRRSRALPARPMACWSINHSQSKPFPSSSPMRKPIRARSTWPRPAAGAAPMSRGELFKMMTGIDLVHVPYRGSYWPDLLSGQVQVAFAPMPSSTGYIQAGTLRALAVTGATRSEALPNIPTVGEFVQGYEAIGWYGLGAPKDTPAAIIDKLNNEINAILADPTMKARLFALGAEPMPMTSAAFGKFMSDEADKWSKVIKFAGIKPD